MGQRTILGTEAWKKKRDDLNSKRNSLFEEYSQKPQDLHLALEIKTIDDEIAEYTDKMRQEALSERKSKSLPLDPSRN
jgi:hypothetical protein